MKFKIGLHGKFVFVLLSFGLSFGIIFYVFMLRWSLNTYQSEFYRQIYDVFTADEFSNRIISARDANQMSAIIAAFAGQFGIDGNNRKYYILDGSTGQPLATMGEVPGSIQITRNILTAVNGSEGSTSLFNDPYMDIAVPVNGYIVYIIDNKSMIRSQSEQTWPIMLQSLAAGLIMSLFLAFVMSKQIVLPLQKLSKVTADVAQGNFPEPIEVQGGDETAMLTERFNFMLAQLRISEQTRRDFVANVSHELRTPITNIRSYAETLVEQGDTIDPETRTGFLNVVLNESDRMTKLVQDLLVLSRIDAGEIQLRPVLFDLCDSVMNVYNASSLDASKRGLTLNAEYGSPSIPVRADKDRLEQVMINILSNALRYTPDSGSITIKCGSDKNFAWFSVSDTGIGIPEGDIPKLFDRFYRVDKARSRTKGGSGLGLAIASEIVDKHNGSIKVNSIINEGTTVTVRFPLMYGTKHGTNT